MLNKLYNQERHLVAIKGGRKLQAMQNMDLKTFKSLMMEKINLTLQPPLISADGL